MSSKLRINALKIAMLFVVLAPLTMSLPACNTTEGAGKDISNTGHAITDTARENK